ncbi:hypothetical protein MSG28_002890 [Choristoneura fumiferana]|uniref:Uncharacterized protein n=1 Tax=Choristoneura fumiferana TaxID=7141 RepID=A0ACC0JJN7_CHOFU|nr:hypothetical protein MSG28_002890 [Choristoneura fumiferana]
MWSKVVALLGMLAAARAILEGPNVCTRQEPYTTKIRVSEQQPYQVKEYTWCFSVPPRCSKYKIKFQQVFKTQILVKYRPVEECCTGFAPDEAGQQCVPVCVTHCVQGKCVAPNTCACDHGYGGPACDILPMPKRGDLRAAERRMRLRAGLARRLLRARVRAAHLWRQLRRDLPVSEQCYVCEERCPDDGLCPQKCRCQNNGKCNVITGKCPAGKWGAKCEKSCECANGASCHHVTGHCHCESGYTGEKHGGECSNKDGSCTCKPGWKGGRCELRACEEGKYGPRCEKDCECNPTTTDLCDPFTGACDCAAGWGGETCLRQCPLLTYGKGCRSVYDGLKCDRPCDGKTYGLNCREPCNCENNAPCDPVTGECICPPGYHMSRCEQRCPVGIRCETQCAPGQYGADCSSRCPCVNNSSCDAQTGRCVCAAGWTGEDCSQPCPPGTYGASCSQRCADGPDGACQCLPGWRGAACETACEPGWWGAGCSSPCRCARQAPCRANDGYCRCPPGYTGAYCTQLGESHAGLSAALVVLVLLCVAAVVLVLLYYRKRVHNLKREMAHVHYTANPASQPEMEYDHLNYTPPANKWKPHYQRMPNGFTPPSPPSSGAPSEVSVPPMIPPLPKLNVAPVPPMRDEEPLNAPTPPTREEHSSRTSAEENDVETP